MNSAFRFEPPHDNSRLVDYYRPIFWITPLKAAGEKGYSLSVGFLFQEEGAPLPAAILAGQRRRAEPRYTTILFIPLSDRKSTRLNSSHITISYAVFCLKKKKE